MRIVLAVLLMAGTGTALADASITFACCAYNPSTVTINQGESVSWSGNFSSHPLRQVDGPLSDVIVPGGFANSSGTFFSQQFNTPGTYYFLCTFHGLAQFGGTMRGSIVVLGPTLDPIFANGFE
jgi:plastocyanin